MRPKDFKRWRKSLGLSQKEAAETLGLKRRVVQYYERGERDGKEVDIPKSVRLACYALAEGVSDYHGPTEPGRDAAEPMGTRGREGRELRLNVVHRTDKAGSAPEEMNGAHANGKHADGHKPGKAGKDKAKAKSAGKASAGKAHAKGHQKPHGKSAGSSDT